MIVAVSVHWVCAPRWRALETAALTAWRASNGKALIIVPSAALRQWWLSRLAEEIGGVHGEAVVTLEKFAERLAQSSGASFGRLARPLELRLAAWDAFHAASDLPPQWRVNGIVEVFLDTVEELELHGLTPERVATALPDDPTVAPLTRLWRHWCSVLCERHLWTVGDVLRRGIEAVRRSPDALPSEIIAYGFTALTDLRWQFLQALHTDGAQHIRFFVPCFTDNEPAYRYTHALRRLLHDATLAQECDDEVPDELNAIVRFAFHWQQEAPAFQPTDRVVCIAAAGEEQEVEMAVRVLTQWRREGKLRRYSDALLLARSLDKYLPALEAISARYGVPFAMRTESGQPAHGLQRLFRALAEACRQGLDGARLWQLLPSPYLQVNGEPLLPPERHKEVLQRIRQNLVETDLEHWAQQLAGGDEGRAQQFREFFAAIKALPLKAPARDHAQAWRQLLDRFVTIGAPPVSLRRGVAYRSAIDEQESAALRQVYETLNSLQAWSTPLSLDEFVAVLTDACRFPPQPLADAVPVTTVVEGRGVWVPVVVVLGLNDGDFPQSPSQFELLTDEHRYRLQQSCQLQTPLKFRAQFLVAERMLFMEAVGAATERLVLAYRRTDAEGKPQATSVFLSAAENALCATGWRWQRHERDLGDVLPRDLTEAVDDRDAEQRALFVAFTNADLATEERATVARLLRDEDFRDRLHAEWRRWQEPQRGAWDGNIPSLAEAIVALLRANGLRVTALEDYGHCPYRFFARHLLGLRRPQDITYIVDHRIIGEVWHATMVCFVRAWQERGDLPDEATLRDIAQRVIDEKLVTYPEAMRELVRKRVLEAVGRMWQAEAVERQQGWRPVEVEAVVQLTAARLGDVPDALKPLPITLKIDRLDENDAGERRVVIYRTLTAPSFQDIDDGVALQLPLSALAAGDGVTEAVFLRLLQFTQSGYSRSCRLVAKGSKRPSLTAMRQKATEHAKRFLANIAAAQFAPQPLRHDDSCRACDFKALCRHSKLRLTERRRQSAADEA